MNKWTAKFSSGERFKQFDDFAKKHFVAIYLITVLLAVLINQRMAGPLTVLMAFIAMMLSSQNIWSPWKSGGIWLEPINRWLIAGATFIIWSSLSVFWGIGGFDSIHRPLNQALYFLSAFIIHNFLFHHRQSLNLTTIVVILTLFCIMYRLMADGAIPHHSEANSAAYFNRIFATVILMSLALAAAVLNGGLNKTRASILIFMLCFVVGLIAITADSQSALAAWVIGWTLMLMSFFMSRKYQNILLGILCVVPLFMPIIVYFGSGWLLSIIQWDSELFRQSSALTRLAIWQETVKLIALNPVVGYGNYAWKAITETQLLRSDLFEGGLGSSFSHPHNTFLQMWLEFGLIGIALFGYLLANIAYCISKLGAKCRPGAIALFAASITVASVSHGAWQSWWVGSLILLSAIVAGLCRSTSS